ncbi:MAG: TetR/AcrR family transcriptional regulator [Coriobacteriales bacterium]|jgi:AcrR family transcriptional regulator|nr:TetR/AcrR family transcriptional regulator [Coriobacteriales bacterium]
MDTKTRITQAAARLFFKNGYAKTTMRAIGEEVGISHVSILSHFNNKADIASTTWWNYIRGLQLKCDQIISELPPPYQQNAEYYRQILWWTLHYKLLSDNQAFREFFISFTHEGPVMTAQQIHQSVLLENGMQLLTIEKSDEFVTNNLITAIDASLASLIGFSMIDYVQAAQKIILISKAIGNLPIDLPTTEEIQAFADKYVAAVQVDILNEFLLADASGE